MVVGLDVTHPSPGSAEDAPSVVGIVVSIDASLGQWLADIKLQEPRKEMVTALRDLMKGRLVMWQKHNKGALPNNILIYRDGVSEGQYQAILDEELPMIRAACTDMYSPEASENGMPRISIVVVGKRHHTRFYSSQGKDADRTNNPCNGTVVDRGVTEARNWDFFMLAHTTLQGTARPAHYYVVYDEIFRSYFNHLATTKEGNPFKTPSDALQVLTHNMCYLFGRATRSVSICPPAYYADLVCDRARRYLAAVFDPSSAGSVASGSAVVSQQMVTLHPDVKDSMFFM